MTEKTKDLPNMKRPCSNCPFRKDSLKGWLGGERMEEILGQDSFACHKTLNGKRDKRKQCAGHMLIKREDNAFYQLAIRMGLEEQLDLSGEELVFAGEQDLIEHHKKW